MPHTHTHPRLRLMHEVRQRERTGGERRTRRTLTAYQHREKAGEGGNKKQGGGDGVKRRQEGDGAKTPSAPQKPPPSLPASPAGQDVFEDDAGALEAATHGQRSAAAAEEQGHGVAVQLGHVCPVQQAGTRPMPQVAARNRSRVSRVSAIAQPHTATGTHI